MSDPIPHSDDPKIQAKIDKAVHHNSLVDYALRWLLHYIERIIAVMTILALLGALGVEIYHMIASGAAYFADVETMLHHILNIVVGLKFVRMLIIKSASLIIHKLTFFFNFFLNFAGSFRIIRFHQSKFLLLYSLSAVKRRICIRHIKWKKLVIIHGQAPVSSSSITFYAESFQVCASALNVFQNAECQLETVLCCLRFECRIIHLCTSICFVRNCTDHKERYIVQICCLCNGCSFHLNCQYFWEMFPNCCDFFFTRDKAISCCNQAHMCGCSFFFQNFFHF